MEYCNNIKLKNLQLFINQLLWAILDHRCIPDYFINNWRLSYFINLELGIKVLNISIIRYNLQRFQFHFMGIIYIYYVLHFRTTIHNMLNIVDMFLGIYIWRQIIPINKSNYKQMHIFYQHILNMCRQTFLSEIFYPLLAQIQKYLLNFIEDFLFIVN